MDLIKIRFWLKLALAILTSFIVISYIFRPSDNQCQMTFMMEPPRFIPIPINEPLYDLKKLSQSRDGKQIKSSGYKLYMYSEFGFPLESDIRRDLKDSMPVLFVPGNAGSYQQVRSLASTCIRRQLQALDAFKFIFYTIDYRAQLSGLSGDLIESQIDFLDLALKQIVSIHPTETNGVIVVGHSVGGFIAKALLAKPNFDTNLVPLLINLASPLTRPFVNFDHKMQQLYETTNLRWAQKQANSNTLTISISGGKSDRLVPVHLSIDPQYDISLTTSSIDGVWLATDHVSITWCRELMNKLSSMLSSLMDKRHTRLIEGKTNQLVRVKNDLFTASLESLLIQRIPVKPEPKLVPGNNIQDVMNQSLTLRKDLLESPMIMNLTQRARGDLFIWFEHIDSLKDTAIYGCQELHCSANQARCTGRMNLIEHFRTVPSRRNELKKRALLVRDDDQELKYLVLDFASSARDNLRSNKVPEFVSLQVIHEGAQLGTLHVPSLSSYLSSRLLRPSELVIEARSPVKQPKLYLRYELTNLNQANQYYSIVVESTSCSSDTPNEASALLIQDQHIRESFYTKDSAVVIIKVDPNQSIMMDRSSTQSKLYLDLYLDGSCEHKLRIELDIWSFLVNLIQTQPGAIIACSSYLAFWTLLVHTSLFLGSNHTSMYGSLLFNWLMGFTGLVIVYRISGSSSPLESAASHQVLLFIVTTVLSSGLIALVEYTLNRLVDLATIFYNFQILIRNKMIGFKTNAEDMTDKSMNSNGANANACYAKQAKLDYEWSVVFLSALGALYLSEVLMRLCVLFMMLKLKLKLSIMRSQRPAAIETNGSHPKSVLVSSESDRCYNMVLSITTICIISSICSLPTGLLVINSTGISILIDANYIACLGSMIIVKSISQSLEACAFKETKRSSRAMLQNLLAYTPRYLYILTLLPIALVSQDVRIMSHVELMSLVWVAGSLSKFESGPGKKKTD